METATPSSPLDALATQAPTALRDIMRPRPDLVKIGAKGPSLAPWAEACGLDLPPTLYGTSPLGQDGVLARVGSDEIILEATPEDPWRQRMATGLEQTHTGVYRIEQQSLTIELATDQANGILAQTCGVDFADQPLDTLVYTRVAGASCAVLPRSGQGRPEYRLWIDFSLAVYLWETLAEIALDSL